MLDLENTYAQKLEQNIVKYSWFKVFTKRVYLPLIVIQLVGVGKVTVPQLAIIAIVTSIVQVILQIPTGYIADKWGNKLAIVLGSILSAVSPLFYIFMPNFFGGMLASVLFFAGCAFQSGAIEAFVHDTLVALGKADDYSKVMGRAQSYGLIGNVVLISLIPATYSINHNLPFIIGFVSLLMMLWLAISFTYPKNESDTKSTNSLSAVKSVVTIQNLVLFIFAGFMAGVVNRSAEYRELLFEDIGIAVTLFGLLLALGSIAGAILGRYIHILDKLKPLTFYLFDLVFVSFCLILIGISHSPIVAVIGFTVFVGYTRVRFIVFQAKMLHDIKHSYKATLISALNLFTVIGEVGAISILAKTIGFKDYALGYLLFGLSVFGIGLLLWLIMLIVNKRTLRIAKSE
jgi:MFS family permease